MITVIVPLYNKFLTIKRTIDSVLNQTLQPSEIIVIDDGSTDRSAERVENLKCPLITLVHQENSGVSAARNKGIEYAQGEWIAFLDSDDFWDNDFLETITHLIENHNNCDVFVTGYRFFDNNRSEVIKNYPSNEGVFQNYFETARKGSPPINSSSVCIRKRCLVEIGGFPENVTLGEDLLTWAKLAAKYKIAYSALPKTNIQFPLTISSQTTFRVPDRIDYVGNSLITLLESMAEKRTHISLKKYIGHWYKMRMTLFVLKGEKQNVAREFRKIIMINPFNLKAYLWFFIGILPKTARSLFINRFLSNTFK